MGFEYVCYLIFSFTYLWPTSWILRSQNNILFFSLGLIKFSYIAKMRKAMKKANLEKLYLSLFALKFRQTTVNKIVMHDFTKLLSAIKSKWKIISCQIKAANYVLTCKIELILAGLSSTQKPKISFSASRLNTTTYMA